MAEEMTIQKATKQQRLLEWSERVAECRQSGISVNRWCSEHGINTKTYYVWQRKVFAAMIKQQKTQLQMEETSVCFAELPAAPSSQVAEPARALAVSIRLGEAAVDIYEGADAKMVEALCRALKSC